MKSVLSAPAAKRAILPILLALAVSAAHAEKTIVRLVLDGPILEAPVPGMEFMEIFGGGSPATLHGLVQKIQKATDDRNISGMALIVETPQISLAQLEEVNAALQAFRAKGKKIYCYLDVGSNISYALASAADDVTMAPNAALDIVGLRAEVMYYKGLFDKLGVDAQMLHCGAYKSAMEPYVRTEPSPEAAENINWLLDGLYDQWVALIAKNRNLEVAKVKDAIDQAPLMSSDALERGLVDRVAGYPDFKKMIQKEYGKDVVVKKKFKDGNDLELDFNNPFAFFNLINEMVSKAQEPKKPGIGMIYIEGPIVTGSMETGLFATQTAASTNIRAAFEKARNDENIKAVVCRVNSPGGSAIASDIIWDAATRCAAEKPLIVSMGSVAGSGGYYVAVPGDTIFADSTTITGSIGVVGGKLVLRDALADKLGVTVSRFTRGKNAGLMSAMERWDEGDQKYMQNMLDEIYDQFKGRVKESRGERIKGDLDDMAGGRVFTGAQALELGLIDKIGTLDDAIALAAKKADLSKYEIYTLPKQPDLADIFRKLSGEETEDDWDIVWTPRHVKTGVALVDAALPMLDALAPEQKTQLLQALSNLTILNKERVGCFMPTVLSAN
ncbi:MAG: signal peptide peptidase SppA [Phycisphaerae bacterium]